MDTITGKEDSCPTSGHAVACLPEIGAMIADLMGSETSEGVDFKVIHERSVAAHACHLEAAIYALACAYHELGVTPDEVRLRFDIAPAYAVLVALLR